MGTSIPAGQARGRARASAGRTRPRGRCGCDVACERLRGLGQPPEQPAARLHPSRPGPSESPASGARARGGPPAPPGHVLRGRRSVGATGGAGGDRRLERLSAGESTPSRAGRFGLRATGGCRSSRWTGPFLCRHAATAAPPAGGPSAERGDRLGVPLALELHGRLPPGPKLRQWVVQTVTQAGFSPASSAVLAVVALDDLAALGVPLRGAPGAGGDAGLAAHAEAARRRRRCRPAARFCMAPVGQAATHQGFSQWKQGMKMYEARGRPFDHLGADGMTWQGLGADRQGLVAFALNGFAGMAPDALLGVL